ncbi:MAG: hypothetical protein AAGA60_30975 [Cyanobacteria bacterium P01_E01_bin.42]
MRKTLVGVFTNDPLFAPAAYIDDLGYDALRFPVKFNLPDTFDQGSAELIANNAGLYPYRFAGTNFNTKPKLICPDKDFVPRKLIFYRNNGNIISVPIANRNDIIAIATQIRTVIEGVDSIPVVCIKLVGEKHQPSILYDRLKPAGKVVTATAALPRGSGTAIQHVYAPTLDYRSDVNFGASALIQARINTDKADDSEPTVTSSILTDPSCFAITDPRNCPGRNPRRSRRFIAYMAGDDGGTVKQFQTNVPITNHLSVGIDTCGRNIAALPPTECLGYEGEDHENLLPLL